MAGEHRPPLTPLPIPLTKDHHCCKKTAHGRRSRFLHKLLCGHDGNREVGEPKCDCPGLQGGEGEKSKTAGNSPEMCPRHSPGPAPIEEGGGGRDKGVSCCPRT